ncbi:EPO protein, partial [Atractosteus spatula]|nr:EPO protein [Atractosteus spatula]
MGLLRVTGQGSRPGASGGVRNVQRESPQTAVSHTSLISMTQLTQTSGTDDTLIRILFGEKEGMMQFSLQQVGFFAVLLMILEYSRLGRPALLRPICDSRVLDRFIREARDTENAMRTCKEGCGWTEPLAVPFTSVNFNEWESKDSREQEEEVQSGLRLLTQAISTARTTVTNTGLQELIDTSYSNLYSIRQILKSLNIQVRAHCHWRERGTGERALLLDRGVQVRGHCHWRERGTGERALLLDRGVQVRGHCHWRERGTGERALLLDRGVQVRGHCHWGQRGTGERALSLEREGYR